MGYGAAARKTDSLLIFQELLIAIEVNSQGNEEAYSAGWGLRSRAVLPLAASEKVSWHERLVTELPKGNVQGFLPDEVLSQHVKNDALKLSRIIFSLQGSTLASVHSRFFSR